MVTTFVGHLSPEEHNDHLQTTVTSLQKKVADLEARIQRAEVVELFAESVFSWTRHITRVPAPAVDGLLVTPWVFQCVHCHAMGQAPRSVEHTPDCLWARYSRIRKSNAITGTG